MTAIYDDSRLTYDSLSVSYDGYVLVPLAGDQPAPTGALSARLQARRATAGVQPGPTGTLASRFKTFHVSLAGSQPPASAELSLRRPLQVRRLDGFQPVTPVFLYEEPGYTYEDVRLVYEGGAAATLTYRRLFILRGVQPAGSGSLSWRPTSFRRQLTGDQPAGSGQLTRAATWHLTVLGQQDLVGWGDLYLKTHRHWPPLTSTQPPATGELATHRIFKRTLTGFQPWPYTIRYEEPGVTYEEAGRYYEIQEVGILFWDRHTYAQMAGEQPPAEGSLEWRWAPYVWAQYETFLRQLPESVGYVTPVETDDGDVRYDAHVKVEQADGGVEIVYRVRAPRVTIKEREKPRP